MSVRKLLVLSLIVLCFHSLKAKQASRKNRTDIQRAIEFMTAADRNFTKIAHAASHALWNWQVNLTECNQRKKEDADKAANEFVKKMYTEARKFKWRTYKGRNATLYRWFELAGKGLSSVESVFFNGKEQPEETSAFSKMSEIFNKVKICAYKGSSKQCNMTFDKGITKVFSLSRDPDELKYYWLIFRKKTGEKYKDLFLKSVKEDNKVAKGFGYRNKAEYNMAMYEDEDFLGNIAKEMKKIMPLYKQIHAYVRKKLRAFYKNESIPRDGPIPAHLLGNMYAQKWMNIFPMVKPYPKSSGLPDVTKAMRKMKMKPIDMFRMAERFFASIGLKNMTPDFWKKSVITKLKGRDMECHGAAYDFFDGKDFRIKMCTEVTSEHLVTIHHEMGHVEYYMHYKDLPVTFRRSANPGFHEAIGDALSLSVFTPDYLRQVGLLKKSEIKIDKKSTINYLMKMALMYAVSPSYAYIIDHWRNQVYNGTIKENELNKMYWKYRFQYQGVCPPSKRTERHFDIGAKYHIPAGVEYFRYFIANIVQFQIYKTLCKEVGHKGPLHECNIYKKRSAGRPLTKLLMLGRSRKWNQVLSTFSEKLYNKIDASAMLEYFKPLMDWLKKNNTKEYIGWKSKNPMSCPRRKCKGDSSGVTDTTDYIVTNYVTTNSDTAEEKTTKLFRTITNTVTLDYNEFLKLGNFEVESTKQTNTGSTVTKETTTGTVVPRTTVAGTTVQETTFSGTIAHGTTKSGASVPEITSNGTKATGTKVPEMTTSRTSLTGTTVSVTPDRSLTASRASSVETKITKPTKTGNIFSATTVARATTVHPPTVLPTTEMSKKTKPPNVIPGVSLPMLNEFVSVGKKSSPTTTSLAISAESFLETVATTSAVTIESVSGTKGITLTASTAAVSEFAASFTPERVSELITTLLECSSAAVSETAKTIAGKSGTEICASPKVALTGLVGSLSEKVTTLSEGSKPSFKSTADSSTDSGVTVSKIPRPVLVKYAEKVSGTDATHLSKPTAPDTEKVLAALAALFQGAIPKIVKPSSENSTVSDSITEEANLAGSTRQSFLTPLLEDSTLLVSKIDSTLPEASNASFPKNTAFSSTDNGVVVSKTESANSEKEVSGTVATHLSKPTASDTEKVLAELAAVFQGAIPKIVKPSSVNSTVSISITEEANLAGSTKQSFLTTLLGDSTLGVSEIASTLSEVSNPSFPENTAFSSTDNGVVASKTELENSEKEVSGAVATHLSKPTASDTEKVLAESAAVFQGAIPKIVKPSSENSTASISITEEANLAGSTKQSFLTTLLEDSTLRVSEIASTLSEASNATFPENTAFSLTDYGVVVSKTESANSEKEVSGTVATHLSKPTASDTEKVLAELAAVFHGAIPKIVKPSSENSTVSDSITKEANLAGSTRESFLTTLLEDSTLLVSDIASTLLEVTNASFPENTAFASTDNGMVASKTESANSEKEVSGTVATHLSKPTASDTEKVLAELAAVFQGAIPKIVKPSSENSTISISITEEANLAGSTKQSFLTTLLEDSTLRVSEIASTLSEASNPSFPENTAFSSTDNGVVVSKTESANSEKEVSGTVATHLSKPTASNTEKVLAELAAVFQGAIPKIVKPSSENSTVSISITEEANLAGSTKQSFLTTLLEDSTLRVSEIASTLSEASNAFFPENTAFSSTDNGVVASKTESENSEKEESGTVATHLSKPTASDTEKVLAALAGFFQGAVPKTTLSAGSGTAASDSTTTIKSATTPTATTVTPSVASVTVEVPHSALPKSISQLYDSDFLRAIIIDPVTTEATILKDYKPMDTPSKTTQNENTEDYEEEDVEEQLVNFLKNMIMD